MANIEVLLVLEILVERLLCSVRSRWVDRYLEPVYNFPLMMKLQEKIEKRFGS